MSCAALAPLLEITTCPVCHRSGYDVVRPAQYPPEISEEDARGFYSASSRQELLDQVVSCRNCGMQFVNPRLRRDILIESYATAEDPDFVAQNPQRIQTFHRLLTKTFSHIGQKSGRGRKLLDIGCAGGAFLVAARQFGFEPVGVEPSRWLADYGRRTYDLDIRDGILEDRTFPENSFDVISIWDVIEHVPCPSDLFKVINHLLKPEGLLLLSYPDIGSTAAKLLGRKWPFWLSVHLHYYDRNTMAKQVHHSGFEVLDFMPLWQTLQLAYVLRRAGEHLSFCHAAANVVEGVGLGRLPFTYNMGQVVVLARKVSEI